MLPDQAKNPEFTGFKRLVIRTLIVSRHLKKSFKVNYFTYMLVCIY